MNDRTKTLGLALVLLGATALSSADAANKYRLYDFEAGTPGAMTTTLQDTIAGQTVVGTNGADGFLWLEVPGDTARPLPVGGVMTVVDSTALSTPTLDAFLGQGTYVDVSDGTALNSPALGSNVALSFSGGTVFDDFAAGGGSRGVLVDTNAYNNNDPVAGGTNTFESFSVLTQGWVRPDSTAMGVEQTVYQLGQEQGAPIITSDGFWKVGSVGPFVPGGEILSTEPVQFDQWSHVAILRGGSNVQMFVNGNLVAGDPNTTNIFFNTFAITTSLGADVLAIAPFTGLIDDFTMSGFADQTFDAQVDLDFFQTVTTVLEVNQETGAMTLRNTGTDPLVFDELTLQSDAGALDPNNWLSIAGNYDADSGGKLDATDNWSISQAISTILAEAETPRNDGATLAAGQSVSLGEAWFQSPIRDLRLELNQLDGNLAPVLINFVDNNGDPVDPVLVGDLDFEGTITLDDWEIFIQNFGSILQDIGPGQSYGLGDFDGDLDVDIVDFQMFEAAFDAMNGEGAFALMVPEPSALALVVICAFITIGNRSRREAVTLGIHRP